MTKANSRRDEVEKLKVKLAEKEVVLKERKSKVEMELSDIQPLVDEAKAAVGKIRKDSLNELRMLRLPPEAINDVLSGVLILMGNFDTSWNSMKSFLAKPSIKQEIMNYDARRITPKIRKKAMQLLTEKQSSFEPKRIQRVSVAAAPLAAWFKANISYSKVLEKIGPLEAELNNAQRDIDDAKENMGRVEQEFIDLDEAVAKLKLNFTRITSEAEALKISLKSVQDTLERAQMLLQKLMDEKLRWDEQVKEIEDVTVALPNYCLLAANFITYLGGYPENVRVECMDKWLQIVMGSDVDSSWNVLRFMNNESDLLHWKSNGLPDDELSYENGMIILNTNMFPFIIDPNGDATVWLTNYLKAKDVSFEMIQQSDPRFIKQLQLSVRFGKTIIVTDIDDINPCLYPLLRKDVTNKGSRQVISVGDKYIDYNEQFQLYLITRNSNFVLDSRCKPLVTECNFSVTKSGLESQLLAITLRSEQPELETKKSQLLQQEEQYKMQLAELEKELLQELAESSGNILENKSLLESLNNTKMQSQNIKTALEESKIVQNDLNQKREIYRILAVIGSNTYFTIKSLQSLNNMYQFSLSTFLSLFKSNLEQTSSSSATKQHIKDLEENLISMVYRYISRSLFKSDRLTFALHFIHSLYPNICQDNEWEYFIGEILSSEHGVNMNIKIPSWIDSHSQQSYKDLCTNFQDLVLKCEFNKYSSDWSHWIRSNAPESTLKTNVLSKIPGLDKFTDFQQLLLLQTFRRDRLSIATNNFINKYLNNNQSSSKSKQNQNAVISMKDLYEKETIKSIPILFVTTPGADPSTELRELAINVVGKDNYHELAMGSGQQYEAINLIKIGIEKGYWICLKNLHLVIPWVSKDLQQLLSSLSNDSVHDNFRLWLTTESHSQFPSILLQNALKITCEPPPGLKQNLNRTLSLWDNKYMALNNNPIRSQLLFILSWFHGIIQERRTYIPQGWTKYYEFNEADLRASMDIIDSIFDKNNISNVTQLPWKSLWGLLSQAIYGGRIDNDIDFNTLNSYLNSYFNSNIISVGGGRNNINASIAGSKWLTHIPKSVKKYEYCNLVNTMSNTDTPDIFGLPLNANNVVSLQNVKKLLQSLKILSVSSINHLDALSVDGMRKLRDTQRKRIAPLIQLWKSMVSKDAKSKMDNNVSGNNNSVLNAVLLEIEKASSIINKVNKQITKIEKGLLLGNGDILTVSIMDEIQELISGIVPWNWNKEWNKGNGPSNPKLFLSELMKRKQILQKWMIQLKDNTFWKLNICVGNSFYPITFLNAFKQYTAHKMKSTMDNLTLNCVWDKSLINTNNNAPILNMDGLYVEGGLFDGKNIKSVTSKDNALSKVPTCYIYYTKSENNEKDSNLKIPVYYSLDRSYKVFDVDMNVKDELKWSLSGLAFLMTNVY